MSGRKVTPFATAAVLRGIDLAIKRALAGPTPEAARAWLGTLTQEQLEDIARARAWLEIAKVERGGVR